MMRVLPEREGFTLIELLIVIVIMGVLAMIAVSLFWRAKDRGIEASLQADLKQAAIQQESYFNANMAYSPDIAGLTDFQPSPGVVLSMAYAGSDGWAATTSHPAITGTRCGLIVGTAPAGAADPADDVGIVKCTSE